MRPSSRPESDTAPVRASIHDTAPARAPGSVRIIGGLWKRTPLAVAAGPGVRPTPDRVRETVFNWLEHQLGGLQGRAVLDPFAGSGALGFEAASRGAARVLMVDSQVPAVRALQATCVKLKADMVEVRQADAMATLQSLARAGQQFDVIFLDPPYGAGWIKRTLPLARQLLTPDGRLYAESEAPLDKLLGAGDAALDGLEILRADKAGQVFYHMLQRKNQD